MNSLVIDSSTTYYYITNRSICINLVEAMLGPRRGSGESAAEGQEVTMSPSDSSSVGSADTNITIDMTFGTAAAPAAGTDASLGVAVTTAAGTNNTCDPPPIYYPPAPGELPPPYHVAATLPTYEEAELIKGKENYELLTVEAKATYRADFIRSVLVRRKSKEVVFTAATTYNLFALAANEYGPYGVCPIECIKLL